MMTARTLNEDGLDLLFRQARTHNGWTDRPVDDALLHQLYDLMKMGPTSTNGCPARILFLRTEAAKRRLLPALLPANIDKTMDAPVTAIIGYDLRFYDSLPRLFPHNPAARTWFADKPDLAETTALRNSSLQGAYFILAARALGLDCGPMSGFDHARVDQEFFSGGDQTGSDDRRPSAPFPGGQVKSNFLCNLGYGDSSKLFGRSPRLAFDDACALL